MEPRPAGPLLRGRTRRHVFPARSRVVSFSATRIPRKPSPVGDSISSGTLVVASVVTDPEFRVTSREDRFDGITDLNGYNVNYDVHPEGEGFLVIDQSAPTRGRLIWILNWTEIVRDMGAGN